MLDGHSVVILFIGAPCSTLPKCIVQSCMLPGSWARCCGDCARSLIVGMPCSMHVLTDKFFWHFFT